MWHRIPGFARVFIIAIGVLYLAVTIDLLFRLPLLGIVMIAALLWVGWSVFGVVAFLGAAKSGKFR